MPNAPRSSVLFTLGRTEVEIRPVISMRSDVASPNLVFPCMATAPEKVEVPVPCTVRSAPVPERVRVLYIVEAPVAWNVDEARSDAEKKFTPEKVWGSLFKRATLEERAPSAIEAAGRITPPAETVSPFEVASPAALMPPREVEVAVPEPMKVEK